MQTTSILKCGDLHGQNINKLLSIIILTVQLLIVDSY